MNLTLIFLVLSIAIGYMLYDTFKKSRQTQTHQNEPVTSRIKTNYATQCKILKDLHEQKVNSIKHRSISIHLDQSKFTPQQKVGSNEKQSLRNVLKTLNENTKIYVLINMNNPENWIQKQMKQILSADHFIPYKSIEGAVAVLRQLNCFLHLESQEKLLKIIRQYLTNIWFSGKDQDESAKYTFTNQIQMINTLQKVVLAYDLKEEKNQ